MITLTDDMVFKWLNNEGKSCHGGNYTWSLPTDNKPGRYSPKRSPIMCKQGYHLCRKQDLVEWISSRLFVAEAKGQREDADNKVVVETARLVTEVTTWNERTAKLFACDCAEHVLPIWYVKCPDDNRPLLAIQASRAFSNGEISDTELVAAWDSATFAAWDSALAAARDAASAAASAAANAAATFAAWDSASAAASAAEKQWQTERLWKYLTGEIS